MHATRETSSRGPAIRQVSCKSILGESGICDFSLNCYTGCTHACTYCYARFMGRFHHPGQDWGSFVDVKTNAPEVLAKQLSPKRLFSPGSVFLSSVCDPYQPVEEQYRLTRQCLGMLLDAGFRVHVQTKSDLVCRDLDIMAGRDNVSVCETITTLDADLARQIEPGAPPPAARLRALRRAAKAGIAVKAFVGPLLPGLTDTPESLRSVFAALTKLPLDEVYVDRLNLRWGVWPALKTVLGTAAPETMDSTREMLFTASQGRSYNRALRATIHRAADTAALHAPLNVVV